MRTYTFDLGFASVSYVALNLIAAYIQFDQEWPHLPIINVTIN